MVCYRKSRERGAWFEVKSVQDVVRSKEEKGEDATFERELLKSWVNYKGYEDAVRPIGQA